MMKFTVEMPEPIEKPARVFVEEGWDGCVDLCVDTPGGELLCVASLTQEGKLLLHNLDGTEGFKTTKDGFIATEKSK
jgi:hypothetical protein